MFWTLSQVAIGGAIGSVLRYLTVAAFGAPWAVVAVNVLGSFVMGMLFVVLATRAALSPLLLAGVLGGFTTFSAFSADAMVLARDGAPVVAGAYLVGTLTLCLAAVWLGGRWGRVRGVVA